MIRFRLFASALVIAGVPSVFAVQTKTWTHREQVDFEKGTLKRLSLRSNGRLLLAPVFREVFDSSTAYIWALAQDSKGTLYAGGGGPNATTAKVFAIERNGKSRVAADIPGYQIQAIVVDKKDQVYAATSPDGKVYRLGSGGKFDVFYDPKAKYIWSLAADSKNNLFVATGDAGEIHRVTPEGGGSIFFRTEETHARSLTVDAHDNVIVGTEPGGLIIRISPAGQGFVVYQASKREVTSVAVAKDGAIYAAAVGAKSSSLSTSTPTVSPVKPQAAPSSAAPGMGTAAARTTSATPTPSAPSPIASSSVAPGSELYRIGQDDYPQRIWSHPEDVVYAIGFDTAGRAIVGTGNKGNIYRIDSELASTLLVNALPSQVTALASDGKGALYAATGNVGKIYQIGPQVEKQGSYESEPLDVGSFAYWGRVRDTSEVNNGKVLVETRSGNLDRPQKNWSPWAPVDSTALRIASPSARFLQYRVTLSAASDGHSPELNGIEVAYLPKNAPPRFEQVEITPPNYRFAPPLLGTSTPPAASGASPATISLPPLGQRRPATSPLSLESLSLSQSATYAKGYIGARWSVTDPNSDAMAYRIEIRGENESQWKLIKDKVREKYLAWDTTAYPDGNYVVRVIASDAPDNPPDQALTASIESDAFTIDNTPPQLTNLAGTRNGAKLSLRWRAKDSINIVSRAEYSLNGGEWMLVQPTTRLSDSPELEYVVTIDNVPTGEQTVAARVTDDYDNQSVEKIIVR